MRDDNTVFTFLYENVDMNIALQGFSNFIHGNEAFFLNFKFVSAYQH